MRILAVTPQYPPASRVGAWLATHAQLAHLAGQGHEVTAWATLAGGKPWTLDGVKVLGRAGAREAGRIARTADAVLGHCGDGGQSAAVASAADVPFAQFWHGEANDPDGPDLAVFNSEVARRRLGGSCRSSIVCRPWTDPAAHRAKPGTHVTLVNCSEAKGVGVFAAVAERLPRRSFLGVFGGHGQQVTPRASNVATVAPVQNMARHVWARTRILVMPSTHEAWGMVGVEALASGIPVIASDLPGLRESLGDAGIFLPANDVARWAAEVERLHDPAEWAAASAKAKARSAELAADDPRPRFAAALEALVGVPV